MAHESEWSRQIAIAAEIRSKIWFGGLNWDPAGTALHLINAIVIVEIVNKKKKKEGNCWNWELKKTTFNFNH